jgi:hypothetical protein
MHLPEDQIIELLKRIVSLLSNPDYHSQYFLIIGVILGSILGFLSSFLNSLLIERKRKKKQFAKYIVDLYALGEEIKHNAYAISVESYPLEYYFQDAALKMELGIYKDENNGLIQYTQAKLDSRIKDREILLARLTGKIAEHNIYFGQSEKINELKKQLDSYNLLKKRFSDCSNLEMLKSKYRPDFDYFIKKEMDDSFLKILYGLLHEINLSVNRGRKRKYLFFRKNK